ncbi:DcaP family trimeric outer membrane transporter [Sphingosinithalassobacter sp. CS137]|uniref:DcaP family trimeric outer membrane transporter n=1 Tax=Sphingosinithalassobacter sp. CS137 TaxID=2762748 RepID=UPI001CB74202|nr:DcaP family trimeric outer membrane transporter [Sphingosinithalassobacter sp. CS137]
MISNSLRRALLAATALSAFAALPAQAQTARESELEARLKSLEAAVVELRAELERTRTAAQVAVASAPAASQPVAVEVAAAVPAPAPVPAPARQAADGPSVRINGFFKTYASVSHYSDGPLPSTSSGHDFYVPGTIPVAGLSEGPSYRANVKQTRIAVSATTPVAGHVLKGLLEVDFQSSPGVGNQRVTNAYNPALRRAFITYDDFLIGQEWSNFQYVAALPETTDYLGPSEGTVFARQTQLRYTQAVARGLTLSVAAENPAATTADAGSATVIENDTDRMPDLTARLNLALGRSELSLAGLARTLTVDLGAQEDSAFGWGVSAAGKLALDARGRHDLRFMVTHGSGIGRYVGLNLAPDAVLVRGSSLQLEPVALTAGFAALRLGWTDQLRSTFMGSAQTIDTPAGLAVAGANKTVWSASANLFYSPIRQFDLGIEFRHGERELVSGVTGRLDRAEFSAKYSF